MGHHRPLADRYHHLLRTVGGARQHAAVVLGVDTEAPLRVGGEERVVGLVGRPDRERHLGDGQRLDLRQAGLLQTRAERLLGHRGGRRGVGRTERLLEPAQRLAQLELSKDLSESRAVGGLAGERLDVELDRDVAFDRRQRLGDPRGIRVLF